MGRTLEIRAERHLQDESCLGVSRYGENTFQGLVETL